MLRKTLSSWTRPSQLCRQMSVVAKSLKYTQHGEPQDVLKLVEDKLADPQDKQVLVKILAAPINPADINTIQGKYPVKPKFPAIAGNEFVGEVVCVGKEVKDLQPGEHVVPLATGLGTWATHAVYNEDQLLAISNKVGLAEAATITVNPCTAYRMLKDFVQLSPGDTVIQNGANSAVGQAVHQLCRAWGINSVGIVRNRPEIGELKQLLECLGATAVLTEEELRTSDIFKSGQLKRPKLAFNCVGGKSATEVSRHLDNGGVVVTYGGMSREPVTVATGPLIFKDIAFRGFWMTRWSKEHYNTPERKQMFQDLCQLMVQGKFIAPTHEMVPLDQFKNATAASLNFKGFTGKKFILNMSC
ncbi:enoyl-[acyl-carrier-protein] reductase, mitochondrial [Drosophila grimshawi]|uniref:Enoyl-[acyl-carrier-protein] reductase, mitochondrial n=1 Tax=Drosophila grimshawi TaxID=7222 RepID=B4J593_DROGR|nr:enoyl-[acyl-carrier-protein] reductase, mitochondrial [Drosophila grimshawi]EDW00719.1 GH20863 [Drosophila grimshawi]